MNRPGPDQNESTPSRTADLPEERQAIPEERERARDKTQPMPMAWRRPAGSAS